jgi:DNA gyrase/topoisomerase IV subunit B
MTPSLFSTMEGVQLLESCTEQLLGIPVVIHKEFGKYVPELIFGELLTGSNFDDTDLKYIGGRNGLGKPIFSSLPERDSVLRF